MATFDPDPRRPSDLFRKGRIRNPSHRIYKPRRLNSPPKKGDNAEHGEEGEWRSRGGPKSYTCFDEDGQEVSEANESEDGNTSTLG